MTDRHRLVLFSSRLAETISWCAAHADVASPDESLRSASLRPENIVVGEDGNINHRWGTEEEGNQVLSVLADQRSKSLHSIDHSPVPLPQSLAGGRLLVCEPNDSVWDGASAHESRGFFDYGDVPPWDTWIGLYRVPPTTARQYERLYLVSWVPPAFIELAEAGISDNFLGCISWAFNQTNDYPFLRAIQQAGLLV